MSERSLMKARDARGAALIALSLALGVLSAIFAPASLALSVWKDYRSLLVDASVPESEVLAALAAGGYDSVISPGTEPVCLSDWVRLESTTLTAALARLVPGDPRGDPYLRALPSWFEASVAGNRYAAYFLPARRAPFASKDLGKCLAGLRGRYVIADSEYAESGARDSIAAILSLAIMIAAILVIPIASDRADRRGTASAAPGFLLAEKIFLRLFLSLPWAVLGTRGIGAAAISSLAVIAICDIAESLDIPLDEYRRSRRLEAALASLRVRGLGAPWPALCALAALGAEPGFVPSFALGLGGTLVALAGYASWSAAASDARRRFVPSPIMRARARSGTGTAPRAILAFLASLGWILMRAIPLASPAADAGSIVMPLPVRVPGPALPKISELRALPPYSGGELPALADWLVHRALQESLPLERVGAKKADPFAPVSVAGPDGDEATLAFDDSWARSAYRSISPASVEGMLAAQGTAVAARRGSLDSREGRPLAPFECVLYIFLLILPLWRIVAGIPAARGGVAEKRRQEA